MIAAARSRAGADGGPEARLATAVEAFLVFPTARSAYVLAWALGTDLRDPAFLAARRRHVVDLLLRGVRNA
jgi:hypothetical protein